MCHHSTDSFCTLVSCLSVAIFDVRLLVVRTKSLDPCITTLLTHFSPFRCHLGARDGVKKEEMTLLVISSLT